MKEVYAIACVVVNHQGQILLLKRASDKKLFPNKWFVVGAYPMSKDEDFAAKTHEELIDETGFDREIVNSNQFIKDDKNERIIIKTFLAKSDTDKVLLNYEHSEYKWINAEEIGKYDTVAGTDKIVSGLLKK